MTRLDEVDFHEKDRLPKKARAFLDEAAVVEVEKAVMTGLAADLEDGKIPLADFDRLYFGVEFCEERLPSNAELEEALAAAGAAGKPLTLVTPLALDPGIDAAAELIAALHSREPGAEVVANDYGVLHILLKDFPSMKATLGRVLARQKKDPRIQSIPDEKVKAYFSASVLDSPPFVDFIKRAGAARVEIDNLPHAAPVSPGLPVSLHFPYIFITTSRHCVGKKCAPCGDVHFLLRHSLLSAPIIFHRRSQFSVNTSLALAATGAFDRIVYHYRMPT